MKGGQVTMVQNPCGPAPNISGHYDHVVARDMRGLFGERLC